MEKNLKEVLKKEQQLVPDYSRTTFIDLIRCLYNRYGMGLPTNSKMLELDNLISRKKHTILLLVDAMGSNLIDLLPENSILKKNKRSDLLTVSPSSTGCVLTSLATAEYPSVHGILGWYNYYRKDNLNYYPITFSERKTGNNLKDYNVNVKDIFRYESKFNILKTNNYMIYPSNIVNSDFSSFIAEDSKRIGYTSYNDAIAKIDEILNTKDESFIYFYISEIDDLEHDYGYDSHIVMNKLLEIESAIKNINLDNVTLIVTADHGQNYIENDITMDFKKYDKYFYALPTIDFGTASYYVKKDMQKEFVKTFNDEYLNKMILFETKEFIDNNIFGPGEISDYMRSNLGEYISICKSGYQFLNDFNPEKYFGTKGNHSGFTADELIIPLIIIDNNK